MTRPIAPDLHPAPSLAFTKPPERPHTCAACGSYHGSVGAGLLCLEHALTKARGEVKRLVGRVFELEAAAKERR